MLDYHENPSFLIAIVHQLLSPQEKFPEGRNLAISQLAELTNRRGDVSVSYTHLTLPTKRIV